jgi:hypothetical protein
MRPRGTSFSMIRTKTTLIVGTEASCELQMPSGVELLSRVSQGFDFTRFGTERQTRDGLMLGQYLGKLAARLGKPEAVMHEAAERIRHASKLAASVDTMLEQYSDDPVITACLKLAIVHFIGQAEGRSILRLTPRAEGDLPIQGTENWLYQFAQLITAGVSRSKVERCFDELTIICFNYDRSIEHFMPHALVMAYGMPLKDAQQLVAAKLKVIHPYGTVGRLPWQSGDLPDSEWGTEGAWNIHNLATHIRTASEAERDHVMLRSIRAAISGAKRLLFLGFGFQPQNVEMLIDYSLSHEPEVMVAIQDMSPLLQEMIVRMLKRKTGTERDDMIMMFNQRAFEMIRDFSLLLES